MYKRSSTNLTGCRVNAVVLRLHYECSKIDGNYITCKVGLFYRQLAMGLYACGSITESFHSH